MVLTRAFASATPAVASDIEGYAAVATEASAVLVPPGEPEPLARELIALLQDEPRRQRLGEGARRVAERYSWDPIARRLLSVYEELASQGVRERAAA
jgi:glycosyltransferase involved in cell wall biosynthesis